VKHSRRSGFQIIRDRLTYGRKAVFESTYRERKRGRDLTWTLWGMPAPEWVTENWPGSPTILAVRCKGRRDGKRIDETLYYVLVAPLGSTRGSGPQQQRCCST